MNLIDLVALLALVQLLAFSALVGRERSRHGIKAPAISGHPQFERAYRVQMNTLEVLMLFLPALYIAAKYGSPSHMAAIGAVYLVGRVVYWRSYMVNPDSRGPGFLMSIGPVFVLLGAALWGVVKALIQAPA